MPFKCPSCGAGKGLKGSREDEAVHIHCTSCEHRWTEDPWACPQCGARMHPVRQPLLQKARGTQQSIIGYTSGKRCYACEPDEERPEGWMSAT